MKALSGSAIFHIPIERRYMATGNCKTTSALATGEVLVKKIMTTPEKGWFSLWV